jgi:hypothetical protein
MLDPDPDEMNADPQPWLHLNYFGYGLPCWYSSCSLISVGIVAFAGSATYFATNVNMYGTPHHLLKNK